MALAHQADENLEVPYWDHPLGMICWAVDLGLPGASKGRRNGSHAGAGCVAAPRAPAGAAIIEKTMNKNHSIVDLANRYMVVFHSDVSLPEGICGWRLLKNGYDNPS